MLEYLIMYHVIFVGSLKSKTLHDSKILPFCDSRNRTAFERAKTDVFRIRTNNVGPLRKIRYARSKTPNPDCCSPFILGNVVFLLLL